jgi:transposase
MTMAYVVEQKVKGHVYLYQVESYWDKDKKQSRQRRVYLGKKDPASGKLIQEPPAYQASDYGHTYFLSELARTIGLTAELKAAFPRSWVELLTLAVYRLAEGKPFYLCADWLQTVDWTPAVDLHSQRISELLSALSQENDAMFRFFTSWASRHASTHRFIVFDITSLSSYAAAIPYAEWGYNRDREALPQINLGVVYGEPSGLPVFYRLYPGSIHDVTTLANLITELNVLSLEQTLFVLDKGFYSAANLSKMAGLRHIIPLPATTKQEQALVQSYHTRLHSAQYAIAHHQHVHYCVREAVSIGGREYNAYLYLNERKRVEERERLLKAIMECESYASSQGYRKKEEFDAFFRETQPGLIPYFAVRKRGARYELVRDSASIDAALSRMGMFVLISNSDLSGEEVLELYRQKDGVEKCFDALKNSLALKRLRVHSQQALEGVLFIEFLALILYAVMRGVLRQTGLNKTLSVPEVLFELRKLKKIRFGRKKTIIAEMTKRQREIFKAFDISAGREPSL